MGAEGRPATGAAPSRATVPSGSAKPAQGGTAAERAAARRNLQRQADDQNGRDNS
jgi:hypothetical protein